MEKEEQKLMEEGDSERRKGKLTEEETEGQRLREERGRRMRDGWGRRTRREKD